MKNFLLEIFIQKDYDKEFIKRTVAKQANEYNKLLAKKDEQIQKLIERVKQLSQVKQEEIKYI